MDFGFNRGRWGEESLKLGLCESRTQQEAVRRGNSPNKRPDYMELVLWEQANPATNLNGARQPPSRSLPPGYCQPPLRR